MAPESLNGRQFMLDNLPKKHTERNRIVRRYFLKNERVPRAVFSKSKTGTKAPRIVVDAAMTVAEALYQLRNDIERTCDLHDLDDWEWEEDLLEDSVELLKFQINDFFKGISADLGEQCEKLAKEAVFPRNMMTPGLDSFEKVSKHLSEAMKLTKESFADFLSSSGYRGDPQDRDSVPAPTFRELLVRNETSRLAEEIFEAIKSTEDKEAALEKTTPIIRRIQKKFSDNLTIKGDPAWLAETMVVVADKQHGIILTGATRAMASQQREKKEGGRSNGFVLLDEVSKTVNSMRLGTNFPEVINGCTKEFCKQVKATGEREINNSELYRNFVNATQSSWYQKLAAPDSTEIFSWAFDGHTFKSKPPCIRCQCLYQTWVLADKPEYEEKKYSLPRHLREYKEDKKPPCTYCAETIAAARVFLLYHGTGVLI